MTVSVVLATYNGAKHVEEQLRSIWTQLVQPDEIVVTDDCSSDGTFDLVKKLVSESPVPVKAYGNVENCGYPSNFLRGIAKARGKYVFLADQDDVWLPGKIAKSLEAFHCTESPLVVISDQMIADEHLVPTGMTTLQSLVREGRQKSDFVHGCCTAFDRCLIPMVLERPDGLGHDDWIHLIGEILGRRVVLKAVGQIYRRHSGATTNSTFNRALAGNRPLRQRPGPFRNGPETEQVLANLAKRTTWLRHLRRLLESEAAALVPPEAKAEGLRRVAERIRALDRRILHLSGRGVSRLRILVAVLAGDYKGTAGFMSALRDVLSRAAPASGSKGE